MANDCFEKSLKSLFFKYGGLIARHPYPFIILPLLLAVGLGTGMVFFTTDDDVEKLYTPVNSAGKTDRSTVEELFNAQSNDSNTLVSHLSRIGRSANAIITRVDGGNIVTKSTLSEILGLHQEIMNISIQYEDTNYTYSDLCIRWNNECSPNGILAVFDYDEEQIPENINLTFPVHRAEDVIYFLGNGLGSVQLRPESQNEVLSARAAHLSYYLRFQQRDYTARSALWEDKYLQVVESFTSTEILVTRKVSSSLSKELDDASSGIIRDFIITFSVLISFSVFSCMMLDWVRSKPWLASCGVLSAGLAILSTFGLMNYIGVPYINVVGSSPFLVLGIGLDDMFIMLAAWRRTDVTQTVEQRMRHAFSEAAMSITITSVTDALALAIGIFSVFRSVQIFCIYTSVAIVFDYAFQITFFGACMALAGKREAGNRHILTCQRVKPRRESSSWAYRVFCAGGSSNMRAMDANTSNDHAIMLFFKQYYGPFITHFTMVTMTVFLFIGYLATAIYGCTQLQEGLALRNLARDNSPTSNFFDEKTLYFSEYDIPVSLVFTEPRDFWNPFIQDLMEEVLLEIEASQFTHGKDTHLTVCWLRDFRMFLDSINLQNPTKSQFIQILRETFLQLPQFQRYSLDIVFSDDYQDIIATRFFVTTTDVASTEKQEQMMTDLRQIAKQAHLPAIAYNPAFVYYDQFPAVLPNTLQSIGVAMGAMLLVALFMMPHPICSVLVTLSIISIVTGVMGIMTLWGVNLDSIAMVNIIICVGFSVDFSAHISYSYITADKGSRRDNVIHALFSLGMPILQGSLSTILGIIILAFTNSYIFRTFFKTMFLVISLGALHGLVFLPVFMKLTVPVRIETGEQNNRYTSRDRILARSSETDFGRFSISESIHNRGQNASRSTLVPISEAYDIPSHRRGRYYNNGSYT